MSDNIEFKRGTGLLIIEVINSNPNGDPDREGDPRQRPDGHGEISPVSFKRKIRDLVENKEGPVWKVVSEKAGLNPEEFAILESRETVREDIKSEMKNEKFTKKYWDGRVFGNTFLEENLEKKFLKTGVVQFGLGISVAPIEIERHTNTKKMAVEAGKEQGMAPMAYRFVRHGIYVMPFFVNPSAAHKSGCTEKDIELLLKLIPHAYSHTRSHARPFVELRHAWYCEHSDALGSCSDFALVDALKPKLKIDTTGYDIPTALPEHLSTKVKLRDLIC